MLEDPPEAESEPKSEGAGVAEDCNILIFWLNQNYFEFPFDIELESNRIHGGG